MSREIRRFFETCSTNSRPPQEASERRRRKGRKEGSRGRTRKKKMRIDEGNFCHLEEKRGAGRLRRGRGKGSDSVESHIIRRLRQRGGNRLKWRTVEKGTKEVDLSQIRKAGCFLKEIEEIEKGVNPCYRRVGGQIVRDIDGDRDRRTSSEIQEEWGSLEEGSRSTKK